jgi:hypothetical protein
LTDNSSAITNTGSLRIIFAALCILLIAIPFFSVKFPPITDLPQQSAQIRLFLETIHDPGASPYKIQWFTPYSLSYLALGVSWAIFGPANAGRIAMLLIGALWIISIHFLAARRNRSASAAVLASCFFFNHLIYWGFYSFAIGWPVFVIWTLLLERKESESYSFEFFVKMILVALLLYLSHILWLLAGLAWLVIQGLVSKVSLKTLFLRILCLAPLVAAVGIWYPMFSGSSMATPPLWFGGPLSRLSFSWLTDSALGGIYGPAEPIILGASLIWVVIAVIQHRSNLKDSVDWVLLAAAGMFLLMALTLPDKFMNTIRFSHRWVPPAIILLVLAAPTLELSPVLRRAAAFALVAIFCVGVTVMWHAFQKVELSGLRESLDALPEKPQTIGLSMIQSSEFIKGYPFIQMFAYSQVLRGGRLNFSFAEFSPCLVVYKGPFRPPWTIGLEWMPARAQESDLTYFDFVIFNGTEEMHADMASRPVLKAVTNAGLWRLYAVKH